jgi:hypothetical protein
MVNSLNKKLIEAKFRKQALTENVVTYKLLIYQTFSNRQSGRSKYNQKRVYQTSPTQIKNRAVCSDLT